MFLNGITIILCGDRDSFEGAAIAWATKVEKKHILVSLPAKATITQYIKSTKVFSVSVLGEHQADIVRQYGGSKQARPLIKNPDDLDFNEWPVPIVRNCRANLLCNMEKEIPLEEQFVALASIEQFIFHETIPPLVYRHDEYFD